MNDAEKMLKELKALEKQGKKHDLDQVAKKIGTITAKTVKSTK